MKRGEVWVANLNPNKNGEIGKLRPVLIMQDDHLIQARLPSVLVLPLTTVYRREFAPMRISIRARDRLEQDSYVMVEHLRAIVHTRLGDGPLTMLTSAEMSSVTSSLLAVLGVW